MTGPRLLGSAVVSLLLAAVVLWTSSRGTWLTVTWDVPLRGRVTATATGADTEPILVPWALLALAAIGGLLATSGWGRRAVGAVVALAGLWAVLRTVTGVVAPVADALPAAARQAGRVVGVEVTVAWPLVGALGGLLLLGAGVLVALRGSAMPRLGARYDAPGARTRPPDEDRSLWEALDAGEDPTRDGAPSVQPGAPDGRRDAEG